MRISSKFFNTQYNTSMTQQKPGKNRKTASESVKNNYDAITISSASLEEIDTKFASALKKTLMNEVSQPTSEKKLENLEQKIKNGTYEVDANKIAERILLYKGENNYG
jgi:negative regulator of flagellin synthesis FlgM